MDSPRLVKINPDDTLGSRKINIYDNSEKSYENKSNADQSSHLESSDCNICVGSVTSVASGTFQVSSPKSKPHPTFSPEINGNGSHYVVEEALPSHDIHKDLQRVLHLVEEERHLVAYDLYEDVLRRLKEHENEPIQEEHQILNSYDSSAKSESIPSYVLSNNSFENDENQKEATEKIVPSPKRYSKHYFLQKISPSAKKSKLIHNDFEEENVEEKRRKNLQETKALLKDKNEEFNELKKRALIFQKVKAGFNFDNDWIKSQTHNGITTYYKREDDGTLSIKIEGEMVGLPLFEQIAVLREVDLFHTWAPFCRKSRKLAELGRLDAVGWNISGIERFGLVRDVCFRAISCDSMWEDGSILLVAKSIEDGDKCSTPDARKRNRKSKTSPAEIEDEINGIHSDHIANETSNTSPSSTTIENTLSSLFSRDSIQGDFEIPPIPSSYGAGRLIIRKFDSIIRVKSPDNAETCIVANVDPCLPLPQFLIDFFTRKICGVVLSKLQDAARKAVENPTTSPIAQCIREDSFYSSWLFPKFQAYCTSKNWDLPPIKAFDISQNFQETISIGNATTPSDTRSRVSRKSLKSLIRMRSRKEKMENRINNTKEEAGKRLMSINTNRLEELQTLLNLKASHEMEEKKKSLPVVYLTIIMLLFFHADISIFVNPFVNNEDACFLSLRYLYRLMIRNSTAVIMAFTYVWLYKSVLDSIFLFIFDNIEIPLDFSESAIANMRDLYAEKSESGSKFISVCILAFAYIKFCSYSFLRLIITMARNVSHALAIASGTISKISLLKENLELSEEMTGFYSDLLFPFKILLNLMLSFCDLIGIFKKMDNMKEFFLYADELLDLDKGNANGFLVTWHKVVLDDTKIMMTYSIIYLLVLLAIAKIILPKKVN